MPEPDRDPWLDIPLGDYEAHMSAPEVGQLAVLADLFAEALAVRRPPSVAILGIAGGNGLEHVDPRVTRRVVGVDIHPDYLETVKRRHTGRLNLELHCVDLGRNFLAVEPAELVHAALIFEHAGTAAVWRTPPRSWRRAEPSRWCSSCQPNRPRTSPRARTPRFKPWPGTFR
jgi:hypothetical protein